MQSAAAAVNIPDTTTVAASERSVMAASESGSMPAALLNARTRSTGTNDSSDVPGALSE